jgi:preprotein translocase subunit SecD
MKINWKIWVLIVAVLLSILAIFPMNFKSGIVINSVQINSSAYEIGLRPGQIILEVNNLPVNTPQEYGEIIGAILPSEEEQKIIIKIEGDTIVLFTNKVPEISVKQIQKTRIKTGLDLSGGARALISTEQELSSQELSDLIAVTNQRLNGYGLQHIVIKPVSDLSGKNYMLIEIAGSTPKELEELIAKQGKFEAKIGNDTVFSGGEDITYVARSGTDAGIYSCSVVSGGEACSFRFAISLTEEAAQRHAEITRKLGVNITNPQYLEKKLDLYLDDQLVDSLFISKDLKGSKTTQISISGSGQGLTREEAFDDAMSSMKQLQTVLITGKLPFKLEIEKLDTISPLLGKRFIETILFAGAAAILAVGLIILIRYKNFKLSIAVLLTSLCEVLIILGVSALFNRNLDLPAIAGIIAAIGTGVDSQIIILDESQLSKNLSLKQRIRNALFIIVGTYVTTLFALLPLIWAGAGLLKGFAITTIIGISAGVLITRPAFSEIVKRILKE